jgi:hypothetical protein
MRQGWTHARLRGGVEGSGLVRTSGFAADIGKDGLLLAGDRFGVRVAQPLRVSSGGVDLKLPGGWDYFSQSVDRWNVTRLNLAPTGREMDFELAYSWPFPGGDVSSNLFLRRQPGNYAAMPVDRGAAVRINFGF